MRRLTSDTRSQVLSADRDAAPKAFKRKPARWIDFVGASLAACATVVAVGCSGGGCSSCKGSSPIPGGFPIADRMPNAAGARVTRQGLDFLAAHIPALAQKLLGGSSTGGIITFPINETSGKAGGFISYTVCKGGPDASSDPPKCIVEIDIAHITSVTLNADQPHDLKLSATIPIRLRDLPVDTFLGTGTACLDDGSGGYLNVPVTGDISLEAVADDVAHAARHGYTKINIKALNFDTTTVSNGIHFCGSSFADVVLGAVKGLVVGSLVGGLSSKLTGPLANATCMKPLTAPPPGIPSCPTGTFDNNAACRYTDAADGECVPMLLGTEMRLDLSGLLASLSPGTKGGLDFGLAADGDMVPAPSTDPATNGMTLGLFGGALPHPIATCITPAPNPMPAALNLPIELNPTATETPPAWWPPAGGSPDYGTGPDLGIGIAEAFLNHAATSAYNSGLLCLGINSSAFPSLPVGAIGALIHGLKHVTDQLGNGDAPTLALTIRPQKAPKITLGTGDADFKSPLLGVQLNSTAIDFYFWSEDRYVRLFTGTIDIGVPLNLEAGKDGIGIKLPPTHPISFKNVTISNNTLLIDADTDLAGVVGGIGDLIPASALSSIKPFKLDSALASLGLTLSIPPGGIRKLDNAGVPYLGIFAKLGVVAAAAKFPTTTTASVIKVDARPSNYELKTFGSEPTRVQIHARSDQDDGTRAIEYAYRVDDGLWTSFFSGRDFSVESPFFILEGKHVIQVASREVGFVDSEGEPATVPVVIDVHPPMVQLAPGDDGTIAVKIADAVSKGEALRVEARFDNGAWTDVPAAEAHPQERALAAPKLATNVEVRVTDEAGNVVSRTAATTPLTIRGRSDGTIPSAGGCGCAIPGGSDRDDRGSTKTAGGLAALAMIGAVVERRRRRLRARELACATLFVTSSGAMGCTCASGSSSGPSDGGGSDSSLPPLITYVRGSFTSSAKAPDGTIWVAGYHEGDPTIGTNGVFGDLIAGKLDPATNTVAWATIDGVPAVTPTYDPNGFRGGIADAGDDVGMYTSMVLNASGNPIVAYYDRTNHGLRVATYDGSKWASHEVEHQAQGWAGKFTAMVLLGGMPAVAYQSIEPSTGGYAKVKVRLARASTAQPASSTDWAIEDVAVDDKSPCVPDLCTTGQKCLVGSATTKVNPVCVTPFTGCDAACTGVCIEGTDGKAACGGNALDRSGGFINAIGTSISLAANSTGGLVVVFYDRIRGNLRGATQSGGAWTVTPPTAPIDGWVGDAVKDVGLGDRGLSVTLGIDSSDNWHLAYVDGITESLLYKFVPGGTLSKAAAAVVVDDGATSDGTTKFTDGLHVIGDNASLSTDGTTVTIVYQDATGGTLRYARGAGGASAKFTRGAIAQEGFGGFWPHVLGTDVVNFYRAKGKTAADPTAGVLGDPVTLGDVRLVPLP